MSRDLDKLSKIVGPERMAEVNKKLAGKVIRIRRHTKAYQWLYARRRKYFDSLLVEQAAQELGCSHRWILVIRERLNKV